MRHAFTLIELMIVIAIIAIIAAIAIPNLLESRVTSQEAAAASALKSGILPAQVQFQAGGYCDLDGNGIGTYAVDGIQSSGAAGNPYNCLCGTSTVGTGITLNLLAPSYGSAAAYVSASATGTVTATAATLWPTVSGFLYKTPVSATSPAIGTNSDGTGEKVWGVLTFPADDQQGRKFFMINQAGNIYMSQPNNNASTNVTKGLGGAASTVLDAGATQAFGATLTLAPLSPIYRPYRR